MDSIAERFTIKLSEHEYSSENLRLVRFAYWRYRMQSTLKRTAADLFEYLLYCAEKTEAFEVHVTEDEIAVILNMSKGSIDGALSLLEREDLIQLSDENVVEFPLQEVVQDDDGFSLEYDDGSKPKVKRTKSSPVYNGEKEAEGIYAMYPRKYGRKRAIEEIIVCITKRKISAEFLRNKVREYADIVSSYPTDKRQYILSAKVFFKDAHYLDDAEEWKRIGKDNYVSGEKVEGHGKSGVGDF